LTLFHWGLFKSLITLFSVGVFLEISFFLIWIIHLSKCYINLLTLVSNPLKRQKDGFKIPWQIYAAIIKSTYTFYTYLANLQKIVHSVVDFTNVALMGK
jgi:hypothetical protein